MADVYGIVGYPLSHTFSPGYFNEKFLREGIDAIYKPFPLEHITQLPGVIMSTPRLKGLNVTIPYKTQCIPFLNEISKDAGEVGAVNCIAVRNGILTGYNTDVPGFTISLQPFLKAHHEKALVLGTGGASLAVIYALQQLGIAVTLVSRKRSASTIAYDEVSEAIIRNHHLIINTTPLGMYPDIDNCPDIPYNAITAAHLLYDLVYNPAETKFLRKGRQQGAVVTNGMEMLHLQAEASWDIWNEKPTR